MIVPLGVRVAHPSDCSDRSSILLNDRRAVRKRRFLIRHSAAAELLQVKTPGVTPVRSRVYHTVVKHINMHDTLRAVMSHLALRSGPMTTSTIINY